MYSHYFSVVFILISALSLALPAKANLIYAGAYSSPSLEPSLSYRTYLRRAGIDVGDTLRGTEMTRILGRLSDEEPGFTEALVDIGETRDGVGYAFFLARLEHDEVRVELYELADIEPVFYVTRVQVTLLLDVFATTRAQSNQRRLESVYNAGGITLLPVGGRFSYPCKTEAAPTPPIIADCYEQAVETAFRDLAAQVLRDKVRQRSRGTRVFQVAPVALSREAAENIETFGWAANRSVGNLLNFELAYLVHRRLAQALNDSGRDDIAILPPKVPWAVGAIAEQIRLRLDLNLPLDVRAYRRFGLTLDVSVERAFMDPEMERLRMPDGRMKEWETRIAKTRLHGMVTRAGREPSEIVILPGSMPENQRIAVARGVRAFRVSPDVTGDALDLMAWWDSFDRASEKLAPQLVSRMARVSDDLE